MTQKFRTRIVNFMPLSWPKRLILAATGITLVGISALFYIMFLPLLLIGSGLLALQLIINKPKATYSDESTQREEKIIN